MVSGWMNMNRFDNFLTDMNGDGKNEIVSAINGSWNRISVFSEEGAPLYNCQIGPGTIQPRNNIRMTDVGDLDKDGNKEIVTGLATGFLNVLDYKADKKWAKLLASPPMVLKVIDNWICVGCEDGSVAAFDAGGKIVAQGKMSGKPVAINSLNTSMGPAVFIMSENGEVKGFGLPSGSMLDATKK